MNFYLKLLALICCITFFISCNSNTEITNCIEIEKERRVEKINKLHDELIADLKKDEKKFMELMNSVDSMVNVWGIIPGNISERDSTESVIMNEKFYDPLMDQLGAVHSVIISNKRSSIQMYRHFIYVCGLFDDELGEKDYKHYTSLSEYTMDELDGNYWDELEKLAAQYDMLIELERCK